MAWNSESATQHYTARTALKEFAARKIKLPDTVTAAVATMEWVTVQRPTQPAADTIRQLILADVGPELISAAVVDDIGHSRLFAEYQQAEREAAIRVLQAFREEHDAIFEQLAEQAQQLITVITTVASLDPDIRLADLVRQGRTDDAKAMAELETSAEELLALYNLRDNYIVSGGAKAMRIGVTDCSQWMDPRLPDHHSAAHHGQPHRTDEQTLGSALLRGIRSGGKLWFPNKDEALAQAEPIAYEEQGKAQRLAEVRKQQTADSHAFAP
ncbi:hypothetical protein [Mycobacterium sp. URHB0021]